MKSYVQLSKEYKDLTPIIEIYKSYSTLLSNIDEAKQIISEGDDPEMKEMAKMELDEHLPKVGLMEEEIFYDTYTKNINLDLDWSYTKFFIKTFLIACISFIMLIEPRLNLLEMWIYGLIDIF